MTVDAVLGLDPSTTKIGWGFVRDSDGAPGPCGVVRLDGSPEAMHRALATIRRAIAPEVLPIFAYVEYPFGGKAGHSIFQSGVAVGYAEMAARLVWPGLTMDRIDSQRWRRPAGVPDAPKELAGRSDEKRAWLKAADCARAVELGFRVPTVGVRVRRLSDDAADAALIAYAAWIHLDRNPQWRIATREGD